MRPILSTALILSLSVSLAACSWNPGFMPKGYTNHGHKHEYKAPSGPKAPGIGYDYSAEQNEEHVTAWRYAIRDLLMAAKAQGLKFPNTVFLKTDLDTSAFQGSFDHILREGMREYGYVLSDAPEGAAEIFYSAYEVEKTVDTYSIKEPEYNDEINGDDTYFKLKHHDRVKMELVIGALENGEIVNGVRGNYELPIDGFTPGKYVIDAKHPLKKKSHDD
jgi:hypothetical protein